MSDNLRQLRSPRESWSIASHTPRTDARFVTPEEFRAGVPAGVRRRMVLSTVVDGLAAAADPDGEILDFDRRAFFERHVVGVLCSDVAPDDQPELVYDFFTAMTLQDCFGDLVLRLHLLATRGNGDSHDYRLILPPPVPAAGR